MNELHGGPLAVWSVLIVHGSFVVPLKGSRGRSRPEGEEGTMRINTWHACESPHEFLPHRYGPLWTEREWLTPHECMVWDMYKWRCFLVTHAKKRVKN